MLKFQKGWIKENRKIVVAEVILTILLVLMFQYIMGQRLEYIDASREPDQTENKIMVEGETVFLQQAVCEKDTLDGVFVFAETEADTDAALSVQVFEASGGFLAQAVQPLSEIIRSFDLGKPYMDALEKSWNWFLVLIQERLWH